MNILQSGGKVNGTKDPILKDHFHNSHEINEISIRNSNKKKKKAKHCFEETCEILDPQKFMNSKNFYNSANFTHSFNSYGRVDTSKDLEQYVPLNDISAHDRLGNCSFDKFNTNQEMSKTVTEQPSKKRKKSKHRQAMSSGVFEEQLLVNPRELKSQQSSNSNQELRETFGQVSKKRKKRHRHTMSFVISDEQSQNNCDDFNDHHYRNINLDLSETLIEKPGEKRKSKHQKTMPSKMFDEQPLNNYNEVNNQHNSNNNHNMIETLTGQSEGRKKKSKHRHKLSSEMVHDQSLIYHNVFKDQHNSNTEAVQISKKKKSKHRKTMLYEMSHEQPNEFNSPESKDDNQDDLNETLTWQSDEKRKKPKHRHKMLYEQSLMNYNELKDKYNNSNIIEEMSETLIEHSSKKKKKPKYPKTVPSEMLHKQPLNNCNESRCSHNSTNNQDINKTLLEQSDKIGEKSKRQHETSSEVFNEQSLNNHNEFKNELNSNINPEISETLMKKLKRKRMKLELLKLPLEISDEQLLNNSNKFNDQHNRTTNQEISKTLVAQSDKKRKKSKHLYKTSTEMFNEQSLIDCNELKDKPSSNSNQKMRETLIGELKKKGKKSKHRKTKASEMDDVHSLNNYNKSSCNNSNTDQDVSGTLFGQPDKSKYQQETSSDSFAKHSLTKPNEFSVQHNSNSDEENSNPEREIKESSEMVHKQPLINPDKLTNHSNNTVNFSNQNEDKIDVQLHDFFEVENKKLSNTHSEIVPSNAISKEIYPDLNLPVVGREILEFDLPILHEKESVAVPTKEMLNEWKSRGIVIKTGKWSEEEVSLLKRNYNNYVTEHGLKDPYYLFGIGLGNRSNMSLQYLKDTHFYARLGRDLNNRTLRSIYIKARDLFNPFRSGEADNEEVTYLMEKRMQVGNKWTKIGTNLDRSGTNCKEIFRWHSKAVNKKKWSHEEIEQLKLAIETVSRTSDLSDIEALKNISWKKVAELVPTRNYSQCRHYWGEHLAWDPSIICKRRWSKTSSAELVSLLRNQNVKDESELDWKQIQASFIEVSPSYIFLQKRWRYLKSRAPIGSNYQQTIDFLNDKYVKKLFKK